MIKFLLISVWLCLISCTSHIRLTETNKPGSSHKVELQPPVITGLENFLASHTLLIQNKRVGLVTNPSGINSHFKSSIDLFYKHPHIKLVALFALEHGIRGDAAGGQLIEQQTDQLTGLPVYSLYGKTKKPTVHMLQNIDVIIFDIQDAGVRSYSFISSMGMILEAVARQGKKMIILDRPNPLGGLKVEGNVLAREFRSHTGYFEIPYRHGMTIGEIARFYNNENDINADLTIIPMINWKREMFWEDTGLPWVATSTHVAHWKTTLFLPITGPIGELLKVNIGVGFSTPFELIAAPWCNARELADSLNGLSLPGLHFIETHYVPYYATYKGELCHGVRIYITDHKIFKPFVSGLYILNTLIKLYPKQDLFEYTDRIKAFNNVMGGDSIYLGLTTGKSVVQLQRGWQLKLKTFLKVRDKYLLY